MNNIKLRSILLLFVCSCACQITQAQTSFENGGCFTREEWPTLLKPFGPSSLIALYGTSVFLPAREEDYRFTLAMYRKDDANRMFLVARNLPEKRDPKLVCLMFLSMEARGVLGDLHPGAPPVKAWITEKDLPAIRASCTEKLMPTMMELYNKQVIEVAGTWMTWYERQAAGRRILGEDDVAKQRKYDAEDKQRVAKTRTEGDFWCDGFSQILASQQKQKRKLGAMIQGKQLRGSKGEVVSDGALALFVPAVSSKPDDPIGWRMYLVNFDGRAYLIGDGDKLELPE